MDKQFSLVFVLVFASFCVALNLVFQQMRQLENDNAFQRGKNSQMERQLDYEQGRGSNALYIERK